MPDDTTNVVEEETTESVKYFTREEAIMGGDMSGLNNHFMSREEAILAGQQIKAFTRKEALRMGSLGDSNN